MARDSFLTFRLDQLSQTAMAKASQVYKERLGLNIRELRVMRAIGDEPGLSSRSLSEATFIEQTLVSKHLRKLVDAGLVRRELESADARRVALQLTTTVAHEPDGSKALDAVIELFTGRSVNDLADAKERHHLKDELMEHLEHEYHGDVMGVYFTEFVTQ